MRSSFLTLALALIASVNAAAYNKRAVSAGVQTCINGLTAAQAQVLVVTTAVNGFSSSSSLSGALAVHTKAQSLDTLVKTAGTHCCAVTKVVSTEDANAVLDMVKGLVPDIEASLSAIVNKKSEFAKVTAAPTIVKADIKSLQGNVVALDTCIVAVTPAEFNTVATGYVTRVNAAFDAANAAYA